MEQKVYEQAMTATRWYMVNESLNADNTTPWLILQDALNLLESQMLAGKAHPEKAYDETAVAAFVEFTSDEGVTAAAEEDLF